MQGVHKWICWVKDVWRLSKPRKENILIYTHTHADSHARIKNIVLASEVSFCVLNRYLVAVSGKDLILKPLILKCSENCSTISCTFFKVGLVLYIYLGEQFHLVDFLIFSAIIGDNVCYSNPFE